MAVKLANVADLVRGDEYQVRRKLDASAVRQYETNYQAGVDMPPVTVALVGNVHILIDGYHRVEAQRNLDRHLIEVAIIEVATMDEAKWLAVEANLKHGVRLKRSDKLECFKRYVNATRHVERREHGSKLKSYRAMGRDLGMHHATLRQWMERHYPRIARKLRNEDSARPTGGHVALDTEEMHMKDARVNLQNALALSAGVRSEDGRAELLTLARELVKRLEGEAEGARLVDMTEDDDF